MKTTRTRDGSKKAPGTAVAKAGPMGVAAISGELDATEEEAREQAGAGTSQAAEDNLLPFVRVLQSNSPQAIKRNEKYVEGAEPGMIIRTDTREVFDKITFVPCYFAKKVNEWIPRDDGGGFVASHSEMPKDAKPHPEKDRWMVTADGKHDLVDTRYEFGYLLFDDGRPPQNACITMKGSEHGVSRGWMGLKNSRLHGGVVTPAWWTAYTISTKGRSNSDGDWFVMEPVVAGWVPKELREFGKKLHDACAAGEKTVRHADEGDDEGGKSPI